MTVDEQEWWEVFRLIDLRAACIHHAYLNVVLVKQLCDPEPQEEIDSADGVWKS